MKLTEQQTRDFIAGADPDQYMTTTYTPELVECGLPAEHTSMEVFSPYPCWSNTGIEVSPSSSGGWYFSANHKVYKTLRGLRNAIKKYNRW